MAESDLKTTCDTLMRTPATVAWDVRRDSVLDICNKWDSLSNDEKKLASNLFLFLAKDEKWEVRKVVADNSHLVDDTIFMEIAALLSEDSTVYVKRSMDQQLSRRRTARKDFDVLRDERTVYAEQLSVFKEKYGELAHKDAITVSENLCCVFTGTLAHDLRSVSLPLIKNTKAILKKHTDKVDSGKIESIEYNLKLLKKMIDDIENYSKKIPEERTVENIHDVLYKSVNMARENAEIVEVDTSKITVDLSNNDGSKFKISRQPFLMALTNIIKNAFESFVHAKSDVDPKIAIQFKSEMGKIRIEITDNGIGISPKDIQSITTFVPGRFNKSKKQSTGFGLPQAMRTIRAHDGEISLVSQEGQGTTIRIELPSTMESEEV